MASDCCVGSWLARFIFVVEMAALEATDTGW